MSAAVLLGNTTPTFQVAPPATSNAAGEVIDLMASISRPMDDWQQLVMHLWLGERGNGLWSAFQLFLWLQRQNGKSYPALARELGGLFLFGESKILHTAHNAVAVMNHWKLTLEVIEANDELDRRLRRVNRKDGEEGLELMSGAELQFRVRSGRGKARGLTGDCVIVDEALYLKPSDMDAFGPTTLARAGAQVIFTSTPPESSEAPIMQVRQNAHSGAPRMAGAEWVNPPSSDVRRPEVIARVNPTYNRRITDERMEDMQTLLGPEGYARECGGIWPDPATGKSIDPRRWAELQDGGSQREAGAAVALGVSIAPLRNISAIALFSMRPDGLGHGALVDFRLGTDWIVGRLVELLAGLNPALVGMRRGVAASLAPDLVAAGIPVVTRPSVSADEDSVRLSHGDLVPLAGGDTAAACGQVVDAVRRGTLRVVPSPDLDASVAGATTRVLDDGITWVRKGLGTEAAPIEAFTIARWIHASFGALVEEDDYDVLDSVF